MPGLNNSPLFDSFDHTEMSRTLSARTRRHHVRSGRPRVIRLPMSLRRAALVSQPSLPPSGLWNLPGDIAGKKPLTGIETYESDARLLWLGANIVQHILEESNEASLALPTPVDRGRWISSIQMNSSGPDLVVIGFCPSTCMSMFFALPA